MIQFLDARASDGKTRKYRVMIGDQLFPLHAAISSNWKIHYYNSQMTDSAAHRAEEAQFLSRAVEVLGTTAMQALNEIQKALGLDYGGIDFSLNKDGEVLLFEANATMAIIPPDTDRRWDYRRLAVERINRAVVTMLLDRVKAVSSRGKHRTAS